MQFMLNELIWTIAQIIFAYWESFQAQFKNYAIHKSTRNHSVDPDLTKDNPKMYKIH